MRLFLALNLPAQLREAAHLATAPLRDAAPAVAWTAADRLHLTVKFLGEQPEPAAERLVDALGAVAGAHPPALLGLGRVGAFPRWRRARVFWLGVRPEPRLELLHHDVEVACAALGHPIEGRAFRPHVTLGRVRTGGEPPELRALADAARGVHFRAEVEAASLDLMLSAPASGGPRYTRLAALALAGLTRAP